MTEDQVTIASKLESTQQELDNIRLSGELQTQDQQEFAKILKKKQASWKEKTQKIKNDFKELLTEYSALQAKYEEEQTSHAEQINEFEKRLEALGRDKTSLTESLDLTRVQFRDETSKFEDEKSLLLNEH